VVAVASQTGEDRVRGQALVDSARAYQASLDPSRGDQVVDIVVGETLALEPHDTAPATDG
jgi:hypothetical protein